MSPIFLPLLQAVAGIPMNIFCIIVLNIAVNTWFVPLYSLRDAPQGFLDDTTPATTYLTHKH